MLSLTVSAESELTKTESTYLAEVHRQSPKEKVSKQSTVRRRKRAHAHLRVPHLEEVLSPVTTPTDEEVAHRIKHVAGEELANLLCLVGWRAGYLWRKTGTLLAEGQWEEQPRLSRAGRVYCEWEGWVEGRGLSSPSDSISWPK